MFVPDGRTRGTRSIRERDILLGRVRSWQPSSGRPPVTLNRRTTRLSMLSMLSILLISNALRWN
jgi:hypothetical protein